MLRKIIGRAVFLADHGFCGREFLQTQRVLEDLGYLVKVVGGHDGVLQSWNGTNWGQSYAVDAVLGQALPADYDIMVVPGGRRSIEKLKLNPHTRAFLTGFVACGKPVIVFNYAVDLFAVNDLLPVIEGETIQFEGDTRALSATSVADDFTIYRNLIVCAGYKDFSEDLYKALKNLSKSSDYASIRHKAA